MANVEQFIKDSGSGNWRPMTSSDLATVKNNGTATVTPAGKSFSMRNATGDFAAAPSILYAINVSFKGATAGDIILGSNNENVDVTGNSCTGGEGDAGCVVVQE